MMLFSVLLEDQPNICVCLSISLMYTSKSRNATVIIYSFPHLRDFFRFIFSKIRQVDNVSESAFHTSVSFT